MNRTDISASKADARKRAFLARKEAHAANTDAAACAHLSDYLKTLGSFDCVAAYMPIRTEISPLPVMEGLHRAGKTIVVPVIAGAGLPLDFSRWTPDEAMVEGPFGARIPKTDEFHAPDVLITPLVAFDASGYRLGYGGGFYDRSFARLRASKMITAIGFAYSGQELPEVPTEPTDQRLDAIVTERGVLTF